MKKILVPTDFSDNAFNALHYAVELFKNEACIFYLLNTYDLPIHQTEFAMDAPAQFGLDDITINQDRSVEGLKILRQRAVDEFSNPEHEFQTRSALNTLVSEVLSTVKEESIDLIVMGTQGATGAQEILFGTHTVDVIKKAKCPIIAVPSKFKYDTPKEILFPTDYEIDFRNIHLVELIHLARKFEGKINFLHILSNYELDKKQQTNKSALSTMFKTITHEYHEVPDTDIIDAVTSYQSNHGTDFLVMIQNKHTFFERFFAEPVIQKIGFHVNVPFMVIPHVEGE